MITGEIDNKESELRALLMAKAKSIQLDESGNLVFEIESPPPGMITGEIDISPSLVLLLRNVLRNHRKRENSPPGT